MKELKITLTFVLLAVIGLGLYYFTGRPVQTVTLTDSKEGKQLFPDFKDPNVATSLEIVKYNPDTSERNAFQVKQVNNRWSIPSHDDYPTDAQTQLIEAASSVIGLEILTQVSTDSGDQETYGVVDPDEKDLPTGARGVGTKVVLKNAHGDAILALIIGNEVMNNHTQRYVRRVGQNPIFTTKIMTDKLSTNFGDWIEKDLLQIDCWDIKTITVNDLSLKVTQEGPALLDGGCMKFAFDENADPSWTLEEMTISQQNGKKRDVKLPEGTVVDPARIGKLAQALDDLKIVDVRRKSEAFSKSLKQDGTWKIDVQTQADLLTKGFCLLPVPGPKGKEVITLLSTDGDLTVNMGDGIEYVLRFGAIADGARGSQNGAAIYRYLFVMVQFNESSIPQPELDTLPDAPNPDSPDAAKAAEINQKIADVKAANEKKIEQYNKQIESGKKRVEQLNKRFADWYYVIDDAEYKKIHVTKQDAFVKQSELDARTCGSECNHDHDGEHHHDADHEHDAQSDVPASQPEEQQPADNPNPPEVNLDNYESPELEEETKPEEAKPEETKQEEAKTGEIKPEEAKPLETKQEEAKTEEVKPEEAKPEETKQEETKTEEVKPEEAKPEQSAVEEVIAEPIEEAKESEK